MMLLPYLHWLALGALLVFCGGYVKGCSDGKAHLVSYQAAVRAQGEAQEERTRVRVANQKRITDEAEKRNRRTVADIRRKYDGMRSSPSSGNVPAVPDASPLVNDEARDNRLLEVLRIAEEQAMRLSELQGWIAENAK